MKYGILVNPVAGNLSLEKKQRVVEDFAQALSSDCIIEGWDTASPAELHACAKQLAQEVDVLIVAGGDGTMNDVINSVGCDTLLSYLPLGTGNIWRNTLGLPRKPEEVADTITRGSVRTLDLVLVEGSRLEKAVVASIGLEGEVLLRRQQYISEGISGFWAYALALGTIILGGYGRANATITIDGRETEVENLTSLIVAKTPYYGFGMKVIPRAKTDDGFLHVLTVNTGRLGVLCAIATSFLGGNRVGDYTAATHISVTLEAPLCLQVDGDLRETRSEYTFEILPAALSVVC